MNSSDPWRNVIGRGGGYRRGGGGGHRGRWRPVRRFYGGGGYGYGPYYPYGDGYGYPGDVNVNVYTQPDQQPGPAIGDPNAPGDSDPGEGLQEQTVSEDAQGNTVTSGQIGEPRARDGLLGQVAPVLAPATGGITWQLAFDANQQLHAQICVDGQCYRASLDLRPALASVMQTLKAQHQQWHAEMDAQGQGGPGVTISGEALVPAMDAAVRVAGENLVGCLVERHMRTVSMGWFSSLKHAVNSAVHSAEGAIGAPIGSIGHTIKKHAGQIAQAAGFAAQYGAGSIPGIGPVISRTAGNLAENLVASSMGQGSAKKAVQQAIQEAKQDPKAAKALEHAQDAVAKVTAAYHIAEVANAAKNGDQGAQQEVQKLYDKASQGDQAAQIATQIADNAQSDDGSGDTGTQVQGFLPGFLLGLPLGAVGGYFGPRGYHWLTEKLAVREMANQVGDRARQAIANTAPPPDAPPPPVKDPKDTWSSGDGWIHENWAMPQVGTGGPRVEIIGAQAQWQRLVGKTMQAALDDLRQRAQAAAAANPESVVGVVLKPDGVLISMTFPDSDQADDWFGVAVRDPGSFTYAAYFDKGDPTWPQALNEAVGRARAQAPRGQAIPRGIAQSV